jgi:hypothetical protein
VASIERTAYPRFKRYYTPHELEKIYTPTKTEIAFALKVTTGSENYFNLLVLLKIFQRLGYFPQIADIPRSVIHHIRAILNLPEDAGLSYQYAATLSRHKKAIRSYLQKMIKYGDLVANAVIFQNVVDLTEVLLQLRKEGLFWSREDVAALSPYLTSHIKRFGDYLLDLNVVPPALDEKLNLVF